MKIAIVQVPAPSVRGGVEFFADGLKQALRLAGHEVEMLEVSFKHDPPDGILKQIRAFSSFCPAIDSAAAFDAIICMKFPGYLIPHPNKVIWLAHQFREAYDIWEIFDNDLKACRQGEKIRSAIYSADKKAFIEARAVFAASHNVADRLRKYSHTKSPVLYPPLFHPEKYHTAKVDDYLFYPSRIDPLKRQHVVIKALSFTRYPVRVRFAGKGSNYKNMQILKNLAHTLKVDDRIEWLGWISEQEKYKQYARSLGVIFIPYDEDYGYVTIEAFASSKPVITCTDSGGPLEFVINRKNGLVVSPSPRDLAKAMDELWTNRRKAQQLGKNGNITYKELGLSWEHAVELICNAL